MSKKQMKEKTKSEELIVISVEEPVKKPIEEQKSKNKEQMLKVICYKDKKFVLDLEKYLNEGWIIQKVLPVCVIIFNDRAF